VSPWSLKPAAHVAFSRFNAALVSMRALSSGSTLRGCAFAHKLLAMPRDARRQRAAGCSCAASAPIRECCATAAGVLLAARALLGTRAGCVRHGCVKESESAGDPPLGLGSLGRAVQMSRRMICRRFARRFDNAQAPASGRSGSWICGQPEQRLLLSVTDLSTIHKQ
jgi:hypothetical protein